MKRPPFTQGTLPNGLRWIHQQVASPAGHVGLVIQAGSRDESDPKDEGLAHFIEHMMFKGTTKRKAFHVLSRVESVGGELNAYTSKEDTSIYASFLKTHYSRAMELLMDVIQNATYPDKEIPKEQDVILDEIDAYKDQPAEMIFDGFDQLLFPDHALGRNILGTEQTVKSFNREDIMRFTQAFYHPERAVLSSVGGISPERFERLAMRFASDWTANSKAPVRLPAPAVQVTNRTTKRTISQSHVILGGQALPVDHDQLPTLVLMNNLLGGPAMNSRLNLNIRERHGIAYHIESFLHPMSDTGIWGIYAGTDADNMDRCIQLILQELHKLRNQSLGVVQLSLAKTQLLGQMALSQESNGALMTSLGKSLLSLGRVDSFDAIKNHVNSITASDIMAMANRIHHPDSISQLMYLPKN